MLSRTSRAIWSVTSKRSISRSNRSAERLSPSASSSGWVSASRGARCASSARRSRPTRTRSPTRYSISSSGLRLAAHRARVELLQLLLDALERDARTRPAPTRAASRGTHGPSRSPVRPLPRHALGERLERAHRALVSGDDPALADDALELISSSPRSPSRARRRSRGRSRRRRGRTGRRRRCASRRALSSSRLERLDDRPRGVLREPVQVDPEQHLAPQPRRPVVEAVQLRDLAARAAAAPAARSSARASSVEAGAANLLLPGALGVGALRGRRPARAARPR